MGFPRFLWACPRLYSLLLRILFVLHSHCVILHHPNFRNCDAVYIHRVLLLAVDMK